MERLNDLYNAPTASGPTPEAEPEYIPFERLLQLLRSMQSERAIEVGARQHHGESDILVKLDPGAQDRSRTLDEIYKLLNLDRDMHTFKLTSNFLDADRAEWRVRTRSISSLLYLPITERRHPRFTGTSV